MGFKINSLLKLTETKANKSCITLLHHILEVENCTGPDLTGLEPPCFDLIFNFFFFPVVFVPKEAEAHHPELLALPEEIEICHKAAGYTCFTYQLNCRPPTRDTFSIFVPRINLDSIQSEAGALVSRLTTAKKKVSGSVDEVKEQFTKVIEVG